MFPITNKPKATLYDVTLLSITLDSTELHRIARRNVSGPTINTTGIMLCLVYALAVFLLPSNEAIEIKRSDDGDPLVTVVERLSTQLGTLQAEMTAQLRA